MAARAPGSGRGGGGVTERAVASLGPALAASRLELPPGATSEWRDHARGEAFLYVVAGSGRLALPEQTFPLAPESVAWLEPGDRYRLEAGEDGLTVLAAGAETEVGG